MSAPKDSYKILVKQCINRETKAQKLLYDIFSPKMLSVCWRYARDKADAEDIFQSGWLKIFEKIYQLKNADLVEWWMKKIFVNEALRFYNNRKRMIFTDETDVLELDNRADIKLIQGFHYDQITKLVQDLPDKMRMVFNLYIIEGFSHKEIAEMMNVTEGTTKSNLHDARKILQQKIILLNAETNIKSNGLWK